MESYLIPIFLGVGFYSPRAAAVLLFLFTEWLHMWTPVWPILIIGFVFLPYTTLWYIIVYSLIDGHWGFLQILVLLAVLAVDIAERIH